MFINSRTGECATIGLPHQANGSLAVGTPTETVTSPSSFLARVTGLFVSPARTLENVARYPRFFAPFLAIMILFAGFWGVVYWKLGLSGMAVAVVQYIRRGTLVSQDEIDFTLQFSRALPYVVLIGGALAILLHLLIISWVGARLAGFFSGIPLKMRAALSLACHAFLAKTLAQTILSLPMVFFGDVNGLNFGNLIPTNIAFFLDPKDTSRVVYVLLQSLDVVQLWYFVLLGIGLSRHSEDRSLPAFLAGGLAALWIGLSVFLAAVGDLLLKF